MRPKLLLVALVVIGVALAGYFVFLAGDEVDAPKVVTVPVDGLDADKAPDRTLKVPAVAVEQAEEALTGEAAKEIDGVSVQSADHTAAKDETPANVPALVLAENARKLKQNQRTTEALPTAGASAGFQGCRTSFVRNQSGRRGVRPTVQVLHYTVSPNRPGWSDVNGITAFFNRSSSQASSHFVIDAEGNCAYIVPIEAKAWTQGGGNPWAVSYEIIATGREKNYLGPAGYAKLRSVVAQVAKRTGIPRRTGRISGCSPSRSGIVQHAHGGTCWGGHHDIGPFGFSAVVSRIAIAPCDARCMRARSLRARNKATHAELKRRRCAPADKTKSTACTTLHRRHRAIHGAAAKERVKL
jgi:hypothetical protein